MPHLGGMLIMDEGSPCFVPFSKAKKGRVSRMSAIQVLAESEGSDSGEKSYLDALVGKGEGWAGRWERVSRDQKRWKTFPSLMIDRQQRLKVGVLQQDLVGAKCVLHGRQPVQKDAVGAEGSDDKPSLSPGLAPLTSSRIQGSLLSTWKNIGTRVIPERSRAFPGTRFAAKRTKNIDWLNEDQISTPITEALMMVFLARHERS
ncbi:hypothetical protein F0562_034330 [Nyssa sinensis]|uniref:Uncharacterized protein n=1 Tax=Nyssa sinensis TaxID=561372 RepID=A0A5J5AFP5_9ASTE|nr:hypothetical protein F0562_034330 [Nyssa sinensis]